MKQSYEISKELPLEVLASLCLVIRQLNIVTIPKEVLEAALTELQLSGMHPVIIVEPSWGGQSIIIKLGRGVSNAALDEEFSEADHAEAKKMGVKL